MAPSRKKTEKCKDFKIKCREFLKKRNTRSTVKNAYKLFNELSCEETKWQLTKKDLHTLQCELTEKIARARPGEKAALTFDLCESAYDGHISTAVVTNITYKDPVKFLHHAREKFTKFIATKLKEHHALKIYGLLQAKYQVHDESEILYIHAPNVELYESDNIDEWYKINIAQVLLDKMASLSEGPSSAAMSSIDNLSLRIYSIKTIRSGGYIPTPKIFANKKAIINPQK